MELTSSSKLREDCRDDWPMKSDEGGSGEAAGQTKQTGNKRRWEKKGELRKKIVGSRNCLSIWVLFDGGSHLYRMSA